MERVLGRFAGEFYAFLRIVAGFLFACHGAQKLLGALGGDQVQLASQMGLAGIIEMVGGTMIAIGLFTSPVAFVASRTVTALASTETDSGWSAAPGLTNDTLMPLPPSWPQAAELTTTAELAAAPPVAPMMACALRW